MVLLGMEAGITASLHLPAPSPCPPAEEQADAWYRRLQASQQAMQELAGQGAALLPPDWEASSTVSGAEQEEGASQAGLSGAGGLAAPGAAASAAGQAPTTVLQIDAQLGELAIFGSGREPDPWWPPEASFVTIHIQLGLGLGPGWLAGG